MAPSQPTRGRDDHTQSGYPLSFGKYSLERRLAVGGVSEVYLARPRAGHHPAPFLVIKRLLPMFLEDSASLGMFATEAQLHRAVHHPNVVKVYEAGVAEGEPYLAMEYIDGVDVFQLLRRAQAAEKAIPIEATISIGGSLCDALFSVHQAVDEAGHELGMIHRDVTPSNIYLSIDGEVRLGDFGIARALTSQKSVPSLNAGLKGKYNYLAPEQVRGDPVDHRADLFSLAVVLAEMLLGAPLFVGSGQLAVLLAIRDCRIDPLRALAPRLPMGLFAVLERALAKDPSDRFPDAHALRDALKPFAPSHRMEGLELVRGLVAWVRDASEWPQQLQKALHDSQKMRAASRASPHVASPTLVSPAFVSPTLVSPAFASPALSPVSPMATPEPTDPLSPSPTPPRLSPTQAPLQSASASPTIEYEPSSDQDRITLEFELEQISAGFNEEEVTVEFDVTPSRVRLFSGEIMAPVPFAQLVEMIFAGKLTAADEVDFMGHGFQRLDETELLQRYLCEQATARTLPAPAPAPDLTFELAKTPFVQMLATLYRAKETGLLLMEEVTEGHAPSARKEVYLLRGTLLHVGPPEPRDLLGQSLVRKGLLTPSQLAQALFAMPQTEGRLGDTLLSLGLLDAVQLFQALQDQGTERMARLFSRASGTALFYRGVAPVQVDFPLELDLSHIVLAGFEKLYTDDALLTRYRDALHKSVRPVRSHMPASLAALCRPLATLLEVIGTSVQLRILLLRVSSSKQLTAPGALRALEAGLALELLTLSLKMTSSAPTFEPFGKTIIINDTMLHGELTDGRELSVPLSWFPKLANATAEQRANWRWIGGGVGVHWPDLDEDLSIRGMLFGTP